jgi:hypothetical protein
MRSKTVKIRIMRTTVSLFEKFKKEFMIGVLGVKELNI